VRPARRREQGVTLVELLVVMAMMAVLGTILVTITVSATRASARQQDQTATLNAAKLAMERITREVRGANSMTYATPRQISFVATYSGARTTTSYSVVTTGTTSEISQSQTRVNLSTQVSTSSTKKVLGGLAVGRSDAVFSYLDGAGVALAPASASPETYAPGAVKSVGVLIVMKRLYDAPAVQVRQVVSIRNFES